MEDHDKRINSYKRLLKESIAFILIILISSVFMVLMAVKLLEGNKNNYLIFWFSLIALYGIFLSVVIFKDTTLRFLEEMEKAKKEQKLSLTLDVIDS
jgi:hypothetical protein